MNTGSGSDEPSQKTRAREALAKRGKLNVPHLEAQAGGSDSNSEREAQAIANSELELVSATREHGRIERLRDHVAIAALILFWVGFIIIVVAGAVWAVHLIIPPDKLFLTQPQLDKLTLFLFGGGLTSFVSGYAKKRLNG